MDQAEGMHYLIETEDGEFVIETEDGKDDDEGNDEFMMVEYHRGKSNMTLLYCGIRSEVDSFFWGGGARSLGSVVPL